ncbi:hypothetical protein SAMN05428939_6617 [Streptomyces sp. TLI_105]|nr:hypothetical protein SAMN05428939_6617 [Streptomyces sp. TLI_105]
MDPDGLPPDFPGSNPTVEPWIQLIHEAGPSTGRAGLGFPGMGALGGHPSGRSAAGTRFDPTRLLAAELDDLLKH